MTVSALSKIEAAGFKVFIKGESLGVAPSGNLTETQREFLKSHKAQIVKELQEQIKWIEISEPNHDALVVTVYTPAGNALEVEARDEEHAEFLQRMNPKPTLH